MAYSPSGRSDAVNGVTPNARWISMHFADPGTTGASEVAGSVRAQTTYPPAVAGSSTGSTVAVQVPSGGPYTHWGSWDASSGGNFKTGGPLPAAETYGAPGTYNVTPTISA